LAGNEVLAAGDEVAFYHHALDVAVSGKPLVYGQSITDGCIDWDMSVAVLEDMATSARERRRTRV
ncbi:hypothetical protein ACC699_39775, partial [Rhizobium ruizarguesonis]